ncbi:uncharacterized protein PAC_16681 [Phialocephala subalpina]|uniref:Heterokaryon incompatibility domain-containing protein n=1 Tax=Phialocephala subalpina TaxID=576137 RepID=A0A1L7XP02_9HELO|nr:uncharacterized protein PAC_16681 [Phialocephala subalpina]
MTRKSSNTLDGDFWRAILMFYSEHNLSFEGDRLPALSVIAAAMQRVRCGTYLTGMWSDTLVLDMLWNPRGDPGRHPPHHGLTTNAFIVNGTQKLKIYNEKDIDLLKFDEPDFLNEQEFAFYMVRMVTWALPDNGKERGDVDDTYTEGRIQEATLLVKLVDESNLCFERIGVTLSHENAPPLCWPKERQVITTV